MTQQLIRLKEEKRPEFGAENGLEKGSEMGLIGGEKGSEMGLIGGENRVVFDPNKSYPKLNLYNRYLNKVAPLTLTTTTPSLYNNYINQQKRETLYNSYLNKVTFFSSLFRNFLYNYYIKLALLSKSDTQELIYLNNDYINLRNLGYSTGNGGSFQI